jgi:hypothetical protein
VSKSTRPSDISGQNGEFSYIFRTLSLPLRGRGLFGDFVSTARIAIARPLRSCDYIMTRSRLDQRNTQPPFHRFVRPHRCSHPDAIHGLFMQSVQWVASDANIRPWYSADLQVQAGFNSRGCISSLVKGKAVKGCRVDADAIRRS